MTAQAMEQLLYRGTTYWMAAEPLAGYLRDRGIKFMGFDTSCWRGYYGSWEIKNDKLFLVGLVAHIKRPRLSSARGRSRGTEPEEVGIDFLFPGQKEVFASWFSGEIRIPTGKLLEYVHQHYFSRYERDNFLAFENGVLKGLRVVYNSKGAGCAPSSNDLRPGNNDGLGEPAETARDWLERTVREKEEKARAKKP